jgi:hypothetical protein
MIPALLHGKLSREQENMEDILTSNVFGVLKYLPPELILLPWLSKARSTDGLTLSSSGFLRSDVQAGYDGYDFWPQWKENECEFCEPDLALRLSWPQPGAQRLVIGIEAKYFSGKSSIADDQQLHPYDQLARQWDNLASIAQKENREPFLIYLTADFRLPADEILKSLKEFQRKRFGKQPFVCYWLSWRHLSALLDRIHSEQVPSYAIELLNDLGAVLRRLDLTFFSGFSRLTSINTVSWAFVAAAQDLKSLFSGFSKASILHSFDWRFRTLQTLFANYQRLSEIAWRFTK